MQTSQPQSKTNCESGKDRQRATETKKQDKKRQVSVIHNKINESINTEMKTEFE